MKSRFLLFTAAILSFQIAFSQAPEIVLRFTGTYDGGYVTLDSVVISNLTQGGDTTIYDTVLSLEYNTGIGEGIFTGSSLAVQAAHPNPFSSKTDFEVFVPGSQVVSVKVTELTGRTMMRFEREVERGWHAFEFTAGRPGYYLLAVSSGNEVKTMKLACSSGNRGIHADLKYRGYIPTDEMTKDIALNRSFPYNLGDLLYFLGYAGSDIDTLSDNPEIDTDYTFVFNAGGFACPGLPVVSYEGQEYPTIQIGEQCWLRANLNVGTMINGEEAMTNNEVTEKYCFDNDEANCDTYGGLYQWNEMMQYVTTAGAQGICPDGWHIPEYDEWIALQEFLGGDRNAGGLMKEEGTEHWEEPNTEATNGSGFTALPGGLREAGVFMFMGTNGFFWTSNTFGFLESSAFELRHNTGSLYTSNHIRSRGFSVRCLQD
jgi:uncharacterized protein (TIGR02145 family)